MLARSEPASGSVIAMAATASPAIAGARNRLFCSSVPNRATGGVAISAWTAAALRYHCARLVGVGSVPIGQSGTHRSSLGFGHQEAAQEDAEAQASQDAEEDPLAAPRARLAEFPHRRCLASRAWSV